MFLILVTQNFLESAHNFDKNFNMVSICQMKHKSKSFKFEFEVLGNHHDFCATY